MYDSRSRIVEPKPAPRMNFAAVEKMSLPAAGTPAARTAVFISKATPGDDEFALWLAPRLEAAGYTVFADVVTLEPGDRWRKEITNTLQTRAAKMLLCCRDATLARDNVQEEIGIGLEFCSDEGACVRFWSPRADGQLVVPSACPSRGGGQHYP